MAQEVRAGATIFETARRHKLSALAVKDACRLHGVEFGIEHISRSSTVLRIVKALLDGELNYIEIGKLPNIQKSREYVRQVAALARTLQFPIKKVPKT